MILIIENTAKLLFRKKFVYITVRDPALHVIIHHLRYSNTVILKKFLRLFVQECCNLSCISKILACLMLMFTRSVSSIEFHMPHILLNRLNTQTETVP